MAVKFVIASNQRKWGINQIRMNFVGCFFGGLLFVSKLKSFMDVHHSINSSQQLQEEIAVPKVPFLIGNADDGTLNSSSTFIRLRSSFSWESSSVMPSWMKSYIRWHADTRQQLTPDNWNNGTIKYLVLRCLHIDNRCGGASDRISNIPFALLAGYQSQRLLLIKWERPHPLEEFLIPPAGGLDWRVPDFFNMKFTPKPDIVYDYDVRRIRSSESLVISARHQQDGHGSVYYDQHRKGDELTFLQVYHDVWRTVFTPTPPIQDLIDLNLKEINLQAKSYTALHLRTKHTDDLTHSMGMIRNAVNCASQLQPGAPVFVAADSAQVTKSAIGFGSLEGFTFVARIDSGKEPLHIDMGSNYLKRQNSNLNNHNASDFYDVFVDLYLLADANCFALGQGGYGKWASAIGGSNCTIQHDKTRCGVTSIDSFLDLDG